MCSDRQEGSKQFENISVYRKDKETNITTVGSLFSSDGITAAMVTRTERLFDHLSSMKDESCQL